MKEPKLDPVWYLKCNHCGTRWGDNTAIPVRDPGCCQSPNIHVWNYK